MPWDKAAMKSLTLLQCLVLCFLPGLAKLRNSRAVVAPREYCQSEKFTASCWKNEVIVMQSAMYGRMRIGKCVEASMGYLGCEVNVLGIADSRCSGKRNCEIRIPDPTLDKSATCHKELRLYLETSYKCVGVLQPQDQACRGSLLLHVSSTPGHISNLPTQTHCNGPVKAIDLEAQPGQKVNITLLDFSWITRSKSPFITETHCESYGYIYDAVAKKNMSICASADRETHVYLSTKNKLRVFVQVDKDREERFLLRYTAVGCPDPKPPKDAWLKREKNKVIVGCHPNRQTWHLRCSGNQWIGVIGNCSRNIAVARLGARVGKQEMPFANGVAIVVIVAVAILICIIIVATGIIYIKRRKQLYNAQKRIKYGNVRTDDDGSAKPANAKDPIKYIDSKNIHSSQNKNQYSHIWQYPLPDLGYVSQSQSGVSDPDRSSTKTNTYGGTIRTEDIYQGSIMSKTSSNDDSRYFVLDSEAVMKESAVTG